MTTSPHTLTLKQKIEDILSDFAVFIMHPSTGKDITETSSAILSLIKTVGEKAIKEGKISSNPATIGILIPTESLKIQKQAIRKALEDIISGKEKL